MRSTYARTGFCNGGTLVNVSEIAVHVVTNALLVGHPTLTKEQVYELGGVHAGIFVRIGQNCSCKRHQYHFKDGVLAQTRSFAKPTPPDITSDKNGS